LLQSQNSGTEKKNSEIPPSTLSVMEPGRLACAIAIAIPRAKLAARAMLMSSSVFGSASRSTSITGRCLECDHPKSPRNTLPTYLANCSGSGRSRPYNARSSARISSVTFGFSSVSLNGSPGAR
jgi:hypothetical protein